MTLDTQHKAAFEDYKEPLKQLEKTFNQAGASIEFFCFVAPLENKMVEIIRKTRKSTDRKLVCIEGDSPARAIKNIATAVPL